MGNGHSKNDGRKSEVILKRKNGIKNNVNLDKERYYD